MRSKRRRDSEEGGKTAGFDGRSREGAETLPYKIGNLPVVGATIGRPLAFPSGEGGRHGAKRSWLTDEEKS